VRSNLRPNAACGTVPYGAGRGTRRNAPGRCRARPYCGYFKLLLAPAAAADLFRVILGQVALVLRLQVDAPFIRTNSEPTMPSSFAARPFSMGWLKKARSSCSCLSFSNAMKVYLSNASANTSLSERSANAIPGPIIQNSARWRPVFEFPRGRSARRVHPLISCWAKSMQAAISAVQHIRHIYTLSSLLRSLPPQQACIKSSLSEVELCPEPAPRVQPGRVSSGRRRVLHYALKNGQFSGSAEITRGDEIVIA
jgi:hypothetical protein